MLSFAEEVARQAGEVLREHFGRASLAVETKAEADYVTEVDRRSEDRIRELIEKELPGHGLLLEESGAVRAGAEYQWVVDPLDGTTNYIHRVPFFSVAVALRHRQRTVVGVVYDPLRGEMFAAEQGEGARLNGVGVSVSREASLARALVSTGFPASARQHAPRYLEALGSLIVRCAGTRRTGSAALDLAYVAAGRLDAFWELGLRPWDIAAGELLVSEGGGAATDFAGGDQAFEGGDVIASNGPLQEAILAVTRSVFASGRPLAAASPGAS